MHKYPILLLWCVSSESVFSCSDHPTAPEWTPVVYKGEIYMEENIHSEHILQVWCTTIRDCTMKGDE